MAFTVTIQTPATAQFFREGGERSCSKISWYTFRPERVMRPVIDGSISLAMARNAHLKAVSIGYEARMSGSPSMAGQRSRRCSRWSASARWNGQCRARGVRGRGAQTGIAYEVQALTGIPYETAAEISAAARLCDLSIVLQPEQARDTFDKTIPLEILFQSGGRPGRAPHPQRPVRTKPHRHCVGREPSGGARRARCSTVPGARAGDHDHLASTN